VIKNYSSSIVGVHAAAKLKSIDRQAIERDDIEPIRQIGSTITRRHRGIYNLITPPIEYNFRDGLYTPKYKIMG
jgi:hypothetical protein